MAVVSRKFFLRRATMLAFLDELEVTVDPGAMSLYLPPGFSAAEIEDWRRQGAAPPVPDELSRLASNSASGAALFYGDGRKCLVLPPFPLKEKAAFNGYVVEPLRRSLTSDFVVGLVLVHLGSYAVAVCRGERLISSKVGTGLVHGRHKKGGSSQGRFQRRRQNQASEFLDRVCLQAREQLEPQAKLVDYIAYGGPRQTVLLLQKRCPFLRSFEDRVLPRLDVPSPRQRVLETAIGRIWCSGIVEWQEE